MSIRFVASLACANIVALVLAGQAPAQIQTAAQQNCINKMNKDGAGASKAQGKENARCVKDIGNDQYGDPIECFIEDPKLKVTKAATKTANDDFKHCSGTPPSFGYTGADNVNDVAILDRIFLIADIFLDPDTSFASCATNPAACTCQQKVWKRVEKAMDTSLKEFVTCKKAALKGGASAAGVLANCITDLSTPGSIAADTKGKLAKAAAKVTAEVVKSCDDAGVTNPFDGHCATLSGAALGSCLATYVACHACTTSAFMDGLDVDCDLFDDGTVNDTCVTEADPICGNGRCRADEDPFACPADCGCAAAPSSPCDGSPQAPGGCFCDEDCFGFDDCCPDVCDVCATHGPCAATCGDAVCNTFSEDDVTCPQDCGCAADSGLCGVASATPGGCFCDDICEGSGDCCADRCDVCTTLPSCP